MEQIFVWTPSDIIAIVLIVAMAAIMFLMYLRLMVGNTIRWLKKELLSLQEDDNTKQNTFIVQATLEREEEKRNYKPAISDEQKFKDALGI